MSITTSIPEPMQRELEDVRALTDQIREHQRAIEEIAEQRRGKILTLRSGRITYREIAASMGVTEQTVFKCLRPTLAAAKAAKEETPQS